MSQGRRTRVFTLLSTAADGLEELQQIPASDPAHNIQHDNEYDMEKWEFAGGHNKGKGGEGEGEDNEAKRKENEEIKTHLVLYHRNKREIERLTRMLLVFDKAVSTVIGQLVDSTLPLWVYTGSLFAHRRHFTLVEDAASKSLVWCAAPATKRMGQLALNDISRLEHCQANPGTNPDTVLTIVVGAHDPLPGAAKDKDGEGAEEGGEEEEVQGPRGSASVGGGESEPAAQQEEEGEGEGEGEGEEEGPRSEYITFRKTYQRVDTVRPKQASARKQRALQLVIRTPFQFEMLVEVLLFLIQRPVEVRRVPTRHPNVLRWRV